MRGLFRSAKVKAMRARLEYIRDHAVGSQWTMEYVSALCEEVLDDPR